MMKKVLLIVAAAALFQGVAQAQDGDTSALAAQIAQQQQELRDLKAKIDSSRVELEQVQDRIESADYRISTLNEKIGDLCGKLKEASGGSASNPACQ
ncbi:hypothetical protein Q4485_15600 [Granulosicoccaceae sp. 1_MG-2023]|nr:hypothetical protein [Granulosicoccaceae sp. 1_MG-2023]